MSDLRYNVSNRIETLVRELCRLVGTPRIFAGILAIIVMQEKVDAIYYRLHFYVNGVVTHEKSSVVSVWEMQRSWERIERGTTIQTRHSSDLIAQMTDDWINCAKVFVFFFFVFVF